MLADVGDVSACSWSFVGLVEVPNILFSRPPSRENLLPLFPASLITGCYAILDIESYQERVPKICVIEVLSSLDPWYWK